MPTPTPWPLVTGHWRETEAQNEQEKSLPQITHPGNPCLLTPSADAPLQRGLGLGQGLGGR